MSSIFWIPVIKIIALKFYPFFLLSVGKNEIAKMLPHLCQATGSPHQTNHCIR